MFSRWLFWLKNLIFQQTFLRSLLYPYPLICTRTCAYQGVRNNSFFGIFCVLIKWVFSLRESIKYFFLLCFLTTERFFPMDSSWIWTWFCRKRLASSSQVFQQNGCFQCLLSIAKYVPSAIELKIWRSWKLNLQNIIFRFLYLEFKFTGHKT